MSRQQELDGMCEFDINRLTFAILNKVDINDLTQHCSPPDYCNNPSDIMPIAIDNKIALTPLFTGDYWAGRVCKFGYEGATKAPVYDIWAEDENPYRAICIVVILMKEAENEPRL